MTYEGLHTPPNKPAASVAIATRYRVAYAAACYMPDQFIVILGFGMTMHSAALVAHVMKIN